MIDHPVKIPNVYNWSEGNIMFYYDPDVCNQFLCHVFKPTHFIVRKNPDENYTVVKEGYFDEVIFECKTYQEALTYLLMIES